MKENKKVYTDSIAKYINESGKSHKQIADELKVSQPTISGMVNGERDPKLSLVVGLSDMFKVSIDKLVGHATGKTADEMRLEAALWEVTENITKFKEKKYENDDINFLLEDLLSLSYFHRNYHKIMEQNQEFENAVKNNLIKWPDGE